MSWGNINTILIKHFIKKAAFNKYSVIYYLLNKMQL